ncbi:OLC1v1035757C1 [Oldenlandia corymbosa var. corymbosa]|uniref:OLC1v1035757C1 n=1 Tax=Oldenlandia corymbosa var. corymbosa TaxID=529605 RepID=A0AAV1CWW7_OLDCO|nr:OLC1v1035757C1 [Oldenlandia corymbosa var. corymbosa]
MSHHLMMNYEHRICMPPIDSNCEEELIDRLYQLGQCMPEAERRRKEEKAKEWIRDFMSKSDTVEDRWDDYRALTNVHHHRSLISSIDREEDWLEQLEGQDEEAQNGNQLINQVCLAAQSVRSCFIRLSTVCQYHRNRKKLNVELDNLFQDASKSNFFPDNGVVSYKKNNDDNSLVPRRKFILEQDDEDEVFKTILQQMIPENNGVLFDDKQTEVIFIVGEDGSGKTSLATRLFNCKKVEQYFQVRYWAAIPDTVRQLKKEAASFGVTTLSDDDLWSLWWSENFTRERFLLVLDDVPFDEEEDAIASWFWGPFASYLIEHGAPGSIILVTTNSDKIVQAMGVKHKHNPDFLPTQDSRWSFLKRVLENMFSRKGWSGFLDNVESIGKEIAEKCSGFPFNLKIIGSHLQFKDSVEEWQQVLDSEIWEEDDVKKFGYAPIYISYQDLSLPLQRCFLYLVAAFPVDTVIKVDNIIRIWMAVGRLGLPPGPDGEAKCMEYFNQLMNRCFFHNLVQGSVHKDEIISFQIDFRVHEFGKWLLKNKSKPNDKLPPKNNFLIANRHHSSREPGFFISLPPVEKKDNKKPKVDLKHVRALDLSGSQLTRLPKAFANCIILQYLNLSGNPLKRLPDMICDLQYLESLDIHCCNLLMFLPHRFGGLQKSLRHLRIDHTTDKLQRRLQVVDKLSNIRTLDVFRAGGKYNKFAVLENLNLLEEICIVIHGKVEWKKANLDGKRNMKSLGLCFAGEGRDSEVLKSIGNIEPPPELEMLKLEGYPAHQLPKGILAKSLKDKLRRLTIRSASNLLSLPAFWKMSSLEFLWLYDIPKLNLGWEFFGLPKKKNEEPPVKEEVLAFPSLKALRIEYLRSWETSEDVSEVDEKKLSKIPVMPHLEEVIVSGCPKAKVLPHHMYEKLKTCLSQPLKELQFEKREVGESSQSHVGGRQGELE